MVGDTRQYYAAPADAFADDPPTWDELKRRRQTRVRIAIAVIVAVAMVAGAAAIVAGAAGHYDRGRQAMAAHRYGAAAEEFAAARILGFSYRDAATLSKDAQTALELDAAQADVKRQERRAVAQLLRTAGTQLDARDPAAVTGALRQARILVPSGVLALTAGQRSQAAALASDLEKAGGAALRGARWQKAAAWAGALRILDPQNHVADSLTARSRKGAALQDDLSAARAAARRGAWRVALREAKAILKAWPGFPGAAALVADARKALAPKPKPKPAVAAPAPAPAPAATTAPAPAPQPPAPKPTTPPPP